MTHAYFLTNRALYRWPTVSLWRLHTLFLQKVRMGTSASFFNPDRDHCKRLASFALTYR